MNLNRKMLKEMILEVLEEKQAAPDVARIVKKMQASGLEPYLILINTRPEFEQFVKQFIRALPTKDADKLVVLRQIIGAKPQEEKK